MYFAQSESNPIIIKEVYNDKQVGFVTHATIFLITKMSIFFTEKSFLLEFYSSSFTGLKTN